MRKNVTTGFAANSLIHRAADTASTYPELRSSTYETADGGEVRPITVDFLTTNNTLEAQRKGIIILRQSRQQRVVTFQGNFSCFKLQPGTTVLLNVAEYGFSGEKFFITEWTMTQTGVALTMIEEIDSSWTDPAGGDYILRSATGVLSFGDLGTPPPTLLTASATEGGVQLDWTNPPSQTFSAIEVWRSFTNARGSAFLLGTTQANTFFDLVPIGAETRYYWIRAIDENGTPSSWEPNLTTTTAISYAGVGEAGIVADPFIRLGASNWEGTGDTYVTGAGIGGTDVVRITATSTARNFLTNARRGPEVYDVTSPGTFSVEVRWRWQMSADPNSSGSPIIIPFVRITDDDETNASNYQTGSAGTSFAADNTGVWVDDSTIILVQDTGTPPRYIQVGITVGVNLLGPTVDFDFLDARIIGREFEGADKPGLVPSPTTETGKFLKDDGTWADPASTASNSFETMSVTDTDSGFTWAATGDAVAASATDTLTIVSGSGIDVDVDAASDAIRVTATGGVQISGTPVDNQLAIWTNATTIEGQTDLTYNGTGKLTIGVGFNALELTTDNATWATLSARDNLNGGMRYWGSRHQFDGVNGGGGARLEIAEEGGGLSFTSGYGNIYVSDAAGLPVGQPLFVDGDGEVLPMTVTDRGFYKWSGLTTAADPGVGNIRGNNAVVADITALYISETQLWSRSFFHRLQFLQEGDLISFSGNDADRWWTGQVTGAPTDNTGWWTVPCVERDSFGWYNSSDSFQVDFTHLAYAAGSGGTVTGTGTSDHVALWSSTAGQIEGDSRFTFNAGGALTLNTGATIEIESDNARLRFGVGADGQIDYDVTSDTLRLSTIGTTGIRMEVNAVEVAFTAAPNGAVTLYFDNAEKLATSATGVDVTGNVSATDFSPTNIVTNRVVKFDGSTLNDSAISEVAGDVSFDGDVDIKTDGTVHWGTAGGSKGRLTWDTGKAIVSAKTGNVLSLGSNNLWDQLVITTLGAVQVPLRVETLEIRTYNSGELILNAGESHVYATAQTSELVYVNAEGGLQINSSPDNWATGWAGRDTTTITGNTITLDGSTITPAKITAWDAATGTVTGSGATDQLALWTTTAGEVEGDARLTFNAGGALTLSTGATIEIASDNARLRFGAGSDGQIQYNSGTDRIEISTIGTTGFEVTSIVDKLITATPSGAVDLYWGNGSGGAKRLETRADGVEVTGALFATNRVDISAADPAVWYRETGVTAGNQNWLMGALSETFQLRAYNDAFGVSAPVFTANRTGTVVDNFLLNTNLLIEDAGGARKFEVDHGNSFVRIRDGYQFRMYEADDTTYCQIVHDSNSTDISAAGTGVAHTLNLGINYNQVDLTGGTDLRVRDAGVFQIFDSLDTSSMSMSHDTTDFNQTFVSTIEYNISGCSQISIKGGTDLMVDDAGVLRVLDSTSADYGQFSHDGTDFNLATANTTDFNIISCNVKVSSGDLFVASGISTQGTVTDVGQVGQISFMDVSSGVGRFGSYNYDTAAWTPTAVHGLTVDLVHNATKHFGTQQYNGTGNTSGAQVLAHNNELQDVGFNTLPQFGFNTSDTLEAAHCGHITGKSTTTARTITGPTSSDVDFPVEGVAQVANFGTSGNITINDTTTCTMYWMDGTAAPVDIVGTGTLAPGGWVSLYRYSTSAIYITGHGFTP